jgi:hypothetical protein
MGLFEVLSFISSLNFNKTTAVQCESHCVPETTVETLIADKPSPGCAVSS